jgi:hypothetical protein
MKKLLLLITLILVSGTILALPTVENLTLRAPGLSWVGTIYGSLSAKGGTEPITFEISNIQNATVSLDTPDSSAEQGFKAEITNLDAPASFQYTAIDANNQKSAPATVTLKRGPTVDEATVIGSTDVQKLP